MSGPTVDVFRPVEGAVLDLASLQSIADADNRALGAVLDVTSPGATGLILAGLELEGAESTAGPPGTIRPNARSEGIVVSPGKAILTDRGGRRYFVEVTEPLQARWPTQAGAAVQGALVLMPKEEPTSSGSPVAVARKRIRIVLGFVRRDQMQQPFLLNLAASLGNGRDWVTDLNRLWQPEHRAIQGLLKRFESLERLVWRAEPDGSVWDRQVLGRNWVRYQTMAAASLQGARMVLQARASTTSDRVRLLNGLFEQLNISVERAGTELLQLVGVEDGAGPYRAIGARAMRDSQ